VDDGKRSQLSAGARVTYDGQAWEVAELAPPSVLLAGPAGTLRRVSISHLLAAPGTRIGDSSGAERPADAGLRLASLDSAELAQLRERVAHVREACTGYRSGSPDLALPGEPRPEYAPGAGRLQRYQAKAAEMRVGVRTVERWAARLERDGPAGLVDERHLRRRAPQGGADARWLAMARTVLAEHADASTPTKDLVLARTAARLDAEHGTGAVPLPGRTRARALLREITRGTSAFGGAKARREIAGRPAAPYGRLEATRPGEYVLLDTTRLDVFAMDPVTLRWVQAELTIAMDLLSQAGISEPVTWEPPSGWAPGIPRPGPDPDAASAEHCIRRLLTIPGQPDLQHAARHLGTTTARLSRQVRQLEDVAGTALLRTGPDGRLTLTAYGRLFARDVRPVLESLEQSRRSNSDNHGTVPGARPSWHRDQGHQPQPGQSAP